MQDIESKFNWCLKSEKRMKRIVPNLELSSAHIKKAKHNIKAANYNIEGGFEDWVVAQLYYAVYHSFLIILFSKGFESKNYECSINAIEHFIEIGEIKLDKSVVSFIRTTGQMIEKDAKTLREEFQYGIKTEVNKEILNNLLDKSKKIVDEIEVMLNE